MCLSVFLSAGHMIKILPTSVRSTPPPQGPSLSSGALGSSLKWGTLDSFLFNPRLGLSSLNPGQWPSQGWGEGGQVG